MFGGGDDAFTFVGMPQVSHDDLDFWKSCGDRIDMTRERAFKRGLCDEGRARMQQHRQFRVAWRTPKGDPAVRRQAESRRTWARV